VLLASGEDPKIGLYSNHVRRALRSIISQQNVGTGFFGNSMYHHGFAMLALAEAYGAVDDRNLWTGSEPNRLSIGVSLELAVRAAITSQKKNSFGGWRYSPDSTDADTSVSGAVLVGLLAARNAGIEVPDEVIDKAIKYFTSMTSDGGQVGYSGGFGGFGESLPLISIATLSYSVARRKDLKQFKATLSFLTQRLETPPQQHYAEYTRYYQAQALFQGDVEAWEKWNKLLVRQLKTIQMQDGSFRGQHGSAVGTSLSLLALALNYRFLPIYER
ncbi:MAG: squalene--hopene cyclase, partial [Planctomycetota bacterium]